MGSIAKPLVVVADDDPTVLKVMEFQIQRLGYRMVGVLNRKALLDQLAQEIPALLMLDVFLGEHDGLEVMRDLLKRYPSMVIVMLTAHASIENAVSAIRLGAYDYLTKPADLNRLQVILSHAVEKHELAERIARLEKIVGEQGPSRPMWGDSPALEHVRAIIASVAPTDASVLIQAESGTGKELVARAIHEQSPRSHGPFVAVSMAAMPRELFESTLFGHEKGAFTGADQMQVGCCETAHKGTLFLDEIGELDLSVQAKLLRFCQERAVQRVGSSTFKTVDVRIVAATNRKLDELVKQGEFREDLYYRLNVVPISIPPLRMRREDIPLLAIKFLQRAAVRNRKEPLSFTKSALDALIACDWPGNVRQLENLIERLVIFARGHEIDVDAIPREVLEAGSTVSSSTGRSPPLADMTQEEQLRPIDRIERQAIVDALARAQGKVGEAARILGMGQATVYRKIKRYSISVRST